MLEDNLAHMRHTTGLTCQSTYRRAKIAVAGRPTEEPCGDCAMQSDFHTWAGGVTKGEAMPGAAEFMSSKACTLLLNDTHDRLCDIWHDSEGMCGKP